MSTKNKIDCEFINDCDEGYCNHCKQDIPRCCEMCSFYHMIDSGYGLCRVFPTTITVAWCRRPCGQYRVR